MTSATPARSARMCARPFGERPSPVRTPPKHISSRSITPHRGRVPALGTDAAADPQATGKSQPAPLPQHSTDIELDSTAGRLRPADGFGHRKSAARDAPQCHDTASEGSAQLVQHHTAALVKTLKRGFAHRELLSWGVLSRTPNAARGNGGRACGHWSGDEHHLPGVAADRVHHELLQLPDLYAIPRKDRDQYAIALRVVADVGGTGHAGDHLHLLPALVRGHGGIGPARDQDT